MDLYVYIIIGVVLLIAYLYFQKKAKEISNSSAEFDNLGTEEPKKEEVRNITILRDVVITDIGTDKIGVLKCIREATGCGLADAKMIVERTRLVESLPVEVAEDLVFRLNSIGACAQLK